MFQEYEKQAKIRHFEQSCTAKLFRGFKSHPFRQFRWVFRMLPAQPQQLASVERFHPLVWRFMPFDGLAHCRLVSKVVSNADLHNTTSSRSTVSRVVEHEARSVRNFRHCQSEALTELRDAIEIEVEFIPGAQG